MKKINYRFTPRKIYLIIALTLVCFVLPNLLTPEFEEPIFVSYPFTEQILTTPSGEEIQIQKTFPTQDYLITFINESSPTSLRQVAEISQIADQLPDNLAIIFIHCGRMAQQIEGLQNSQFHLYLDPDLKLTREMQVYTIPTLYLLTNAQKQIFYSKKFVSSEELYPNIQRLKN